MFVHIRLYRIYVYHVTCVSVCMFVYLWCVNIYPSEDTSGVHGTVIKNKKKGKKTEKNTRGSHYARSSDVLWKQPERQPKNRTAALKFDFAFRSIFDPCRNVPLASESAPLSLKPGQSVYLLQPEVNSGTYTTLFFFLHRKKKLRRLRITEKNNASKREKN